MNIEIGKSMHVEVPQTELAVLLALLYFLLITITIAAFMKKAKTIDIITIIIMALGLVVLGYLWFTSPM